MIRASYPINHPSSDAYTFERNPYYWKVDSVGNRLPYINRYVCENATYPELMLMKIMAGDITWNERSATQPATELEVADFTVHSAQEFLELEQHLRQQTG